MANLTFNEKQLIESVFNMSSGYILEFSNREFEEFMKDVVPYSIYKKYPGLSKAKMLREFLKDETETYIGKAIVLLINYMKNNGLVSNDKEEKVNTLYELGKKFLDKVESPQQIKQKVPTPKNTYEIDYNGFNTALIDLEKITNSQSRGYAFEKYINGLFKIFNLDPHASYRTEYDQIDGSFVLGENTVLIEAKYRKSPIPKDDLILFSKKIESKSHFAKGLFITYSLVDDKAIAYFTDRSSRIIVLTVGELYLMCQNKVLLQNVLHYKFRILDEKGLIYMPINEFISNPLSR
jgi:hypothetical protein